MSAFTDPLAQVRAGITPFHDSITKNWSDDRAAGSSTSHDPACGKCAALAALDRVERLATDMETALERIAEQQPKTLDWLRAHGIIFDGPLGTDPDNWENVAFSIYSDLCETDSIARAVLSAREEGAGMWVSDAMRQATSPPEIIPGREEGADTR